MWDTANQYVFTGETSGLLALVLFLAAVVYCFKYLGNARKAAGRDLQQAGFLWLLGVALFSNLIAFLGICYFDQTSLYWYALLAMIVAAAAPDRYARTVRLATKFSALEVDGREGQPDHSQEKLGVPTLMRREASPKWYGVS